MADNHLIVLVHGLWGSASNLDRVDKVLHTIIDKEPSVNIHTLLPSTFSQFKTYDGIEHIGNYVVRSIFKELERLKARGVDINKISFIGYSLGGLISRYVIGELYGVGFFDLIKPVFFTTFATPHLGVRFFASYGSYSYLLNFLGSNFLGQSGKDMFIKDGESGILYEMALKDSKYYQALTKFEKLVTLANVRYDRTVAFYTSYMTRYDVFRDWDHVSLEMTKGLPSAHLLNVEDDKLQHIETQIIDLEKSFKIAEGPVINGRYHASKKRGVLYLVMGFTSLIFPIILSISIFASIKSFGRTYFSAKYDISKEWSIVKQVLSQDVKDVDPVSLSTGESSESGLEFAKQEIANTAREVVEDGMNLMDNTDKEENLEEFDESADDLSNLLYSIDCDFKVNCVNESKAINTLLKNSKFKISNSPLADELDPLPFDEIQNTIHDNLNELDWIKIPVYLPSLNAHQTIVARRGFSTTSQGIPLLFLYGYYVKRLLKGDLPNL